MNSRSQKVFLQDILDCIEKIESYIAGITYDEFVKSPLVTDAVVRNLEIIGEAARNISDDLRNQFPKVPWKRIIGLRNLVIHGYFGIDHEII